MKLSLVQESGFEYTPSERHSFWLHTVFALMCLPLYMLSPTSFGLVISPYLLYLAIFPKPQYLLPIVLHLAYGSQQRSFFCLGCFIYVLLHCQQLQKYKLRGLAYYYFLIFPFFVWYTYQKITGFSYVGGIGEKTSGIGAYFALSCAFWAVLVVRRVDRLFYRGFLLWSCYIVVSSSLFGNMSNGMTVGSEVYGKIFTRQCFWAIPHLFATFAWLIFTTSKNRKFELYVSGMGCFFYLLDMLHILRMRVTFTLLGLSLFAVLILFMAIKMKMGKRIYMLPLFIMSIVVVWLSADLVERYGGMNNDLGGYEEIKIKDWQTLLQKLQMKAIDDRASVWNLNIQHIKRQFRKDPIFVDTVPYVEGDIRDRAGQLYAVRMAMDAHNVMLNQLRYFGCYGGLGMYIMYVIMFSLKRNRDILAISHGSPIIVILAVCLSQGVVGGHTGHYPASLAFGPMLFLLMGACWRWQAENVRNFRTR